MVSMLHGNIHLTFLADLIHHSLRHFEEQGVRPGKKKKLKIQANIGTKTHQDSMIFEIFFGYLIERCLKMLKIEFNDCFKHQEKSVVFGILNQY